MLDGKPKRSRSTRGQKRNERQASIEETYRWGLANGLSDKEIALQIGWRAKRPDDYFRIYRKRGYQLPKRGHLH